MNHNETPSIQRSHGPEGADPPRRAERPRGPRVLFIAASALGVAAMPSVAAQVLSTLGSVIVSTAHAGVGSECKPEIHPGYEKEVIALLKKHEVLPAATPTLKRLVAVLAQVHRALAAEDDDGPHPRTPGGPGTGPDEKIAAWNFSGAGIGCVDTCRIWRGGRARSTIQPERGTRLLV